MLWDDWSHLTLHQKMSWLERAEIVKMLEAASIQCYDNESTEVLRDALLSNVLDGTIDRSVIENAR